MLSFLDISELMFWPLLTLDTVACCILLVLQPLPAVEVEHSLQIPNRCYLLDFRSLISLIRSLTNTTKLQLLTDCHSATYSITSADAKGQRYIDIVL